MVEGEEEAGGEGPEAVLDGGYDYGALAAALRTDGGGDRSDADDASDGGASDAVNLSGGRPLLAVQSRLQQCDVSASEWAPFSLPRGGSVALWMELVLVRLDVCNVHQLQLFLPLRRRVRLLPADDGGSAEGDSADDLNPLELASPTTSDEFGAGSEEDEAFGDDAGGAVAPAIFLSGSPFAVNALIRRRLCTIIVGRSDLSIICVRRWPQRQ